MFGIQKPRKGLFGSMGGQPPFGTPPIVPEPQWQTSPVAAAQQMPEQKPGLGTRLLGQGWEDKAFALGGMLQGDPRGAMMLQQQKGMQAQAAVDAAQEQRKRAADLADWKWKQEWERANPAPTNNDTVADYEFIKQRLGDGAAEEYLRNKANPPQYRQGPDGRFYRIDTAPVPQRPIGKLTPIAGGPQATPAGTFR